MCDDRERQLSAERPINPAFSRNSKPPALAGGVFTLLTYVLHPGCNIVLSTKRESDRISYTQYAKRTVSARRLDFGVGFLST